MAGGLCESVGEADADIGGIGILTAFGAQGFISLVLSFWVLYLSSRGKLNIKHAEGTPQYEVETKRQELLADILIMGNDAQVLTDIALIITGLASARTIDLYHLHLIFDTVSLVGVSNTATMICWSVPAARMPCYQSRRKPGRLSRFTPRMLATYLFFALFLALTILINVKLNSWDEDVSGRCYHTHLAMSPFAKHPRDDQIYISITSIWLLLNIVGPSYGKVKETSKVLALGLTQYPLHLYMLIAMRTANQDFLEGDHAENEWKFGQTIAVVLLGVTICGIMYAIYEVWEFHESTKENSSGSVKATVPNLQYDEAK
ncbi:hypothetical protein BT63DRAFT_476464 [Microthyrium microscopicum]|uniref:Uncharacterized protein n=1 Tax=Microthyrium microscopicum TaxID=703497 RepID=A0A6A6UHC4_9PEZI|nr:hypothetical protein BT63DRAFT_476464 [Microthyrium microscopicum]